MNTVEIRDLVVRYGDVTAVDGMSMSVGPGEVVGLLGGNGAGKSSTLRALAGVNPPTAGRITVSGHDLSTPGGADRARQVLGYCPDVGGLIRGATVREHIALALALHQQTDQWPQAMRMAERFDLLRVFDRTTQGFSHGMSRRLSVLLAALTARDLLILDEPFDGVDPTGVDATMDIISGAADAGVAVVVSTHLLDLIVQASQRVVVMVTGTVVDTEPAVAFEGPAGKARYADLLTRNRASTGEVATPIVQPTVTV